MTHTVTDCRDPTDNKFFALALSGRADLILTGDDDLLVLHPCVPSRSSAPPHFSHCTPESCVSLIIRLG